MKMTGANAAHLSAEKLDQAFVAAILAGRLGREVLLKYRGRLQQVEEKHLEGLVSEADRESEKVIFESLRKNFPTDLYMGEESTSVELAFRPEKVDSRWIVDPLDGTTNYVHGLPIFAVSIGLEIKGQIEVAVIDCPALGEVYSAIRGRGAWVNGRPLKVSATEKLRDSLLATGFIGDHEDVLQEQLKIFGQVVRSCRGVRRAGAAAYDLCMVASGVFDAYWEKGLKPWDSAAGLLLVEEAGGEVSTYRGNTFSPFSRTMLATNGKVTEELRSQMEKSFAKDSD